MCRGHSPAVEGGEDGEQDLLHHLQGGRRPGAGPQEVARASGGCELGAVRIVLRGANTAGCVLLTAL